MNDAMNAEIFLDDFHAAMKFFSADVERREHLARISVEIRNGAIRYTLGRCTVEFEVNPS